MRRSAERGFLLLAMLAGGFALADTRPPVDIPALHDAQAQDAALAAIDGQMQRGEWEAARAASAALLDRSKNAWHGALQRALVRLAFLEAKLGEDEEARWHWEALQAMGGASLGTPFFRAFGAAGEKLRREPARAGDEVPPGVESVGPRPGLVPARRTGGEVPRGNGGCTASRGPLWARVQAVIDRRGRLTQPTISGPSVCFSFEVLKAARGWTFEPARRKGIPVAAMYVEAINPPARRPLRELASNGVGEALSRLEAGEFPAAEGILDRQWNGQLDAGSPSRPLTVTLMALRALALAAHDGPEDRRRATCLWEAAQGEDPAFYDADLAPIGEAGKRLDPHRYGEVRSKPMEDLGERIERPRVLPESRRVPRERFAPASYGEERVFIEAVVDAQGALREPLLFGGRDGMRGLDLDALDAVCSWRFAPATVAGRPIDLLYVLSLDVGANPPR
ncbi:MAG TPA: hypothetical protein VFS34_13345 [Thermoanaerobaculia bacterium]|nr:hypothetical protein [Thermoanaerobaculia bacterium]